MDALASNEQKKCEAVYHALTADRLCGFLERVRAETEQPLLMEELHAILRSSPKDDKERMDEHILQNTEELNVESTVSWADLSTLPVTIPEEPYSLKRRLEASDDSCVPIDDTDRLTDSPVSALSSLPSTFPEFERIEELQTPNVFHAPLKKEDDKDSLAQPDQAAQNLFACKPESLRFEDFEVSRLYKQKVVLTNTGRSVNQLRFIGCSKEIENFIHVRANPSGTLSPGMTYTVEVSFFAPINQDVSGEIRFLSPVGVKTVPVVCLVKRFQPYLEPATVVFADSVVGEVHEREVILGNLGALGCNYEIKPVRAAAETTTIEYTAHTPPTTADTSDNDIEELQEIRIGDVTLTGPIRSPLGAKSTLRLSLRWQPTNAREVGYDEASFQIAFADSKKEPLTLVVKGRARDVAIWLEETSVDFGLCWFDRLYQKSLLIHNRSTHAVRVNAIMTDEVMGCIEVLPKSVIVQASDTSRVQLKLLPRTSLKSLNQLRREGDEQAGEKAVTFDAQSGSLRTTLCFEVPEVNIQSIKVNLAVTLTTSDLLFEPPLLDFGRIPTSQMGLVHFLLINPGLIPLKFGFMDVPRVSLSDFICPTE
ncbi:unnamed protein product [Schistocephalus solidus]|uniref:CFAP74 third Ig-like domain-containing protein n=1 Tax=Schistocephalus solidus TaxID=70667 RepID=A0A3P7E763_SCHSO|nr:unnamed protein product [Schistocephalus solidus]